MKKRTIYKLTFILFAVILLGHFCVADFLSYAQEPEEDAAADSVSDDLAISGNTKDNGWTISYGEDGKTEYALDTECIYGNAKYSLRIKNKDYNVSGMKQTFSVKPNTWYSFTAMVRYEGYEADPKATVDKSGASLGKHKTSYSSGKSHSSEWKKLEYVFRTKDETKYTLELKNGIYYGACKGTAWFCDLDLREASSCSNEWNILAIVFKNVQTSDFSASFDAKDVQYEAEVTGKLKDALYEMSDGLMSVKNVDVVSTEVPATEWKPNIDENGILQGYYDVRNEDVISEILDSSDKMYNQIFLIYPAYDYTKYWWGMSSNDFRGCNVCRLVDRPGGKTFGTSKFCTNVFVHEMCHDLEADTIALGYDTCPLHYYQELGYTTVQQQYDWYCLFLQDKTGYGKTVDKEAYQVAQGYNSIFRDGTASSESEEISYVTLGFTGVDISSQTVRSGWHGTKPEDPVKDGYIFDGWYTDESYTEYFDFYLPMKKDAYVYAKWVKDDPDFVVVDGKLTAYKGKGGDIVIPEYVSDIGSGILNDYKDITSIGVAENNKWFCSIDGVLLSKDKKTLVVYPNAREGDYTVPAGTKKIENYGFFRCKGITKLTLPEDLEEIGSSAILQCGALKSINIPKGLKKIGFQAMNGGKFLTGSLVLEQVESIAGYAFHSTGITDVNIEGSISTIDSYVFGNCVSLNSVYLPTGIIEIKKNAFSGCKALTDLYYAGTEKQWEMVKKDESGIPENCRIHCTARTFYTVSFDGTDLKPVQVEEGKCVARPQDPVKDGYDFAGWYADAKYTLEYDFDTPVTSDLTIYAKWEKNVSIYGKVLRIGPTGDYENLYSAFSAISAEVKKGTASNEYLLEIENGVTETRALKTPKGDITITLKGERVNLSSAVLKVNCDLDIICDLNSVKPLNIKVSKGRSVTISSSMSNPGTISGTKSSKLYITEDVTAVSVKNFASVESNAATLSIQKSFSGIGSFEGSLNCGTSTRIDKVTDAYMYLKTAYAKNTTIGSIGGVLSVSADALQPVAATYLFNLKEAKLAPEKVQVLNKDEKGRELKAYRYQKGQVKAAFPRAITMGGVYYPDFEQACLAMTDPQGIYTIQLNEDISLTNPVLPRKVQRLSIIGGNSMKTLDIGKSKSLIVRYPLIMNNVKLTSHGELAALKVKASYVNLANVRLGSVSSYGWIGCYYDVWVNGAVTAAGLFSDAGATLSCQSLKINKLGVSAGANNFLACPITLGFIGQNGEYVKLQANSRIKAVKKFKGNFDDSLLLLSEENLPNGKLALVNGKMYAVTR